MNGKTIIAIALLTGAMAVSLAYARPPYSVVCKPEVEYKQEKQEVYLKAVKTTTASIRYMIATQCAVAPDQLITLANGVKLRCVTND